jgi:hypothetical protein
VIRAVSDPMTMTIVIGRGLAGAAEDDAGEAVPFWLMGEVLPPKAANVNAELSQAIASSAPFGTYFAPRSRTITT